MSKVSCVECGVSILPATAASTGGFCMPCKTGGRQSIDQARERRREQRDDPLDKLWRELVRRVYETAPGFSGLSEVEKKYFAVGVLVGDVYNGGFDQYFFNSSADYYQHALSGLEEIGRRTRTFSSVEQSKCYSDFETCLRLRHSAGPFFVKLTQSHESSA